MNGVEAYLRHTFSHYWWLLALRGLCAVIFGALVFAFPGMALLTLVFLFGAYAIADGILALVHAFSAPAGQPHLVAMIVTGLISLAAGVLAFVWPHITVWVLLLVIACWAIVNGIFEMATAIRLRRVLEHEWLLALGGLLLLVLGVLMLAQPVAGVLALLWWIGGFSIAFGVVMLTLALRLRRGGAAAQLRPATP